MSEWAARCPICHHAADDAVDVPAEEKIEPVSAVAPRVPTRRPRWRRHPGRLLLGSGAVAVALLGTLVVVQASGTPTGGKLAGRILSWTAAGSMVSSTARGGGTEPVTMIPGTGLFLAPDGRFLASGTGQELTLQGNTLAGTGRQVPFVGPPGSWRAVDFADHDQALIATEEGLDGQTLVEVVSFKGQHTASLGAAQDVAGDPRSLGVFAVAAGSGAPQVEWRDSGEPPIVLATAGDLLGDLHERPTATVALSVLPDPQGEKLAVTVVPAGAPAQPTGIVVLSRTGQLLGSTSAPRGTLGRPSWSPTGSSLVYSAPGARGPAIALWSIGGAPSIRDAPPGTPGAGTGFGDCIWAVGGTDFLCASSNNNLERTAWLIGGPGHAPLSLVYGPALPVAWIWD